MIIRSKKAKSVETHAELRSISGDRHASGPKRNPLSIEFRKAQCFARADETGIFNFGVKDLNNRPQPIKRDTITTPHDSRQHIYGLHNVTVSLSRAPFQQSTAIADALPAPA